MRAGRGRGKKNRTASVSERVTLVEGASRKEQLTWMDRIDRIEAMQGLKFQI
jgi:hypothetical protein